MELLIHSKFNIHFSNPSQEKFKYFIAKLLQ